MPVLRPTDELVEGQFSNPIRWIAPLDPEVRELIYAIDASDAVLELGFGPGRSRRLRSWGHDADGVHWLATRGGTPYHTDPNYARFTHHLVVRNDGWRIRGKDDAELLPMVPGVMYCLDTWSPHQVVKDPRLGHVKPNYKLQVAVDRDIQLDHDQARALLIPALVHPPAARIGELRPGPAPKSPVRR